MARTKISEFSATPANNTDIDSINIAEGCAPSGINDAIRELMAQLKDFQTGAVGDSFNGPIGTSTAAAGAFTTLSASSTLGVTGVATFTAQPILSSLTASRAVFSDGSKGLVSNAITGTGNVVMSASPTLTGTVGGASLTLSSLTAGRVTYAGTSGLLQDSANLTFNGTTLTANTLSLTNALATTSGGTGLTSFTSGGVVYASSTSALATGSALTFDGTNLGFGGNLNSTLTSEFYLQSPNGNNFIGINQTSGYVRVAASGQVVLSLSNTAATFNLGGTRMMDLTSTGLGIGTSSPDARVDAEVSSGNAYRAYKSTTGGFTAYRLYTSNENVIGTVGVTSTNDTFYLGYTSTPVLTWNQNCVGVGGATPSTSGAGITFPATQSASSNANTLDDYEEGTWTPDLGGTTTYSSQVGRYTKVGRLVTFQCSLSITSIGTGSTTQISGLPFGGAAFNSANGGNAIYYDTIDSNVSQIVGYIGTTNIVLVSTTAFANSIGPNAIFKNGTTLTFQGFYFV